MIIQCPNIKQTDLEYAIKCLEACKQDDAAAYGFPYPYFTPGGAYGKQWWQLDSSLSLRGYQWIDRAFAETALLNFIESQKDDGRICLWGADALPSTVAGGDFLPQTKGVSSLPKLFDVAYHILRGSKDESLKPRIYEMLKRYLDWWFSARFDADTGLISAVFEETFIPYLGCSGEYAPVDTNVEVYVGCHYVELLALELGKKRDADEMMARKEGLKKAINQYLWNEEKGAYFPYFLKKKEQGSTLMASAFYPLRLQIAPPEHRERLILLLTSQEHFHWDLLPITSVSKKDLNFKTTVGDYKGNASWSGNVWTLINEMVVRGLCDCGEDALAADLAFKTISAFSHNCAEFLNPFDGEGHGVLQYAWSASQYLELIIEFVFGIDYDAKSKTVRIRPRIKKEFYGERFEIKGLWIGEGVFIDVAIEGERVYCTASDESIKVTLV